MKKTETVNTLKLLILIFLTCNAMVYAQTNTITSEEFIKFNTNDTNNPIHLNRSLNVNGHIRMAGYNDFHQLSSWSGLRLIANDDNDDNDDRGSESISFWVGGVEETDRKMIIQPNGNVGIGVVTSADEKLEVRGNIRMFGFPSTRLSSLSDLIFVASDAGGYNNSDIRFLIGGTSSDKEKMRIHSNGDVTINSGGDTTLNQVSMNTDAKVDHAALTVAGATYIGPQAEKASTGDLAKFDQEYIDDYNLWVEDGIVTEDIVLVNIDDWSDHIFSKDYDLPKLAEVEEFIQTHGHLKNIPSESKVKQEGYKQHELNRGLLEKIEELTLYIIAQEKRIARQETSIIRLEKQLNNHVKTSSNGSNKE